MHPRFQSAFTQLAADLQTAIAPLLACPHFSAELSAEQVSSLKTATGLDEDALAFALLPLAAACARQDAAPADAGPLPPGGSRGSIE